MTNNDEIINKKYSLISLIPYANNSRLISRQQKIADLYLSENILNFSIDSIETFFTGNFVQFDAQVGENLCQIRAYKILNVAKKKLYNKEFKISFQVQIDHLKNHHTHLKSIVFEWEQADRNYKSFNKNLDAAENVFDFFNRTQIEIELTDDIIFIIACRFLTFFSIKENNMPLAMNLEQIALEFNISKYRAKRLVRRHQQLVCQLGCEFIYNLAKKLPPADYVEILPSLYKISDEDRPVLPCYLVSKIIFDDVLYKKNLVLIAVKRFYEHEQLPYDIVYFLLQRRDHQEFSLIPCDAHLTQHCMVVSGEVYNREEAAVDYIYRFLSENPLKLILANTAIHPQYSGNKLVSFRENPFHQLSSDCNSSSIRKQEIELADMREFASRSGCSNQDPTTFFLKHVYANTIGNEINKLPSDYIGCAFNACKKERKALGAGHRYDNQRSKSFEST